MKGKYDVGEEKYKDFQLFASYNIMPIITATENGEEDVIDIKPMNDGTKSESIFPSR